IDQSVARDIAILQQSFGEKARSATQLEHRQCTFLHSRGFGGESLKQFLSFRPVSRDAVAPMVEIHRIEEIVLSGDFFHIHRSAPLLISRISTSVSEFPSQVQRTMTLTRCTPLLP